MRSFTEDFPPKPVSLCFTFTQPFELPLVRIEPVQPWAVAPGCPPGPPFMLLSLYQLFGSPKFPTRCQVAPPSMEDCSTAPLLLKSAFHQAFISKSGSGLPVRLKHGVTTED